MAKKKEAPLPEPLVKTITPFQAQESYFFFFVAVFFAAAFFLVAFFID